VSVAYELQRRVQASLSIYDRVYYLFTLSGEGAGGPSLHLACCNDKDRLQVACSHPLLRSDASELPQIATRPTFANSGSCSRRGAVLSGFTCIGAGAHSGSRRSSAFRSSAGELPSGSMSVRVGSVPGQRGVRAGWSACAIDRKMAASPDGRWQYAGQGHKGHERKGGSTRWRGALCMRLFEGEPWWERTGEL
jgi:hypothetical protein